MAVKSRKIVAKHAKAGHKSAQNPTFGDCGSENGFVPCILNLRALAGMVHDEELS
jgi:hypothetical protein